MGRSSDNDSDDERAKRISRFLKDPDINSRWTSFNITQNREARKSRGKVLKPNTKVLL